MYVEEQAHGGGDDQMIGARNRMAAGCEKVGVLKQKIYAWKAK